MEWLFDKVRNQTDSTNQYWTSLTSSVRQKNPRNYVWLQNQVVANVHPSNFSLSSHKIKLLSLRAQASPAPTRLYCNLSLDTVQGIIGPILSYIHVGDWQGLIFSLNYSNFLWIKPCTKLTLITIYNYDIKWWCKISGCWKPK